MSSSEPTIADLITGSTRTAVHLEMRDHYGVTAEADDFRAWLETGRLDTDPASPDWAPWVNLVRQAVAGGVTVRRARIVSELVTDYIRYEHASPAVNLHAGEEVRWLPRRHASDIAAARKRLLALRRTPGAVGPLLRRRGPHRTRDIRRPSGRQTVRPGIRRRMGPRHAPRPVRNPLTREHRQPQSSTLWRARPLLRPGLSVQCTIVPRRGHG